MCAQAGGRRAPVLRSSWSPWCSGGCPPGVALATGITVTVVRLAVLGWVIGYLRVERPSVGTFLAGIVLALTGLTVAVLKWWLTH